MDFPLLPLYKYINGAKRIIKNWILLKKPVNIHTLKWADNRVPIRERKEKRAKIATCFVLSFAKYQHIPININKGEYGTINILGRNIWYNIPNLLNNNMIIIGMIIITTTKENRSKLFIVIFLWELAIFSIIHMKIAVYTNVDKILNWSWLPNCSFPTIVTNKVIKQINTWAIYNLSMYFILFLVWDTLFIIIYKNNGAAIRPIILSGFLSILWHI